VALNAIAVGCEGGPAYAVAGGAIVLLAYATLGRYLRLIGEES